MDGVIKKLEKYKYLLVVLIVGLVLILLPSRSSRQTQAAVSSARSAYTSDEEARLEAVLSNISGAGRASVLVSETGVAVVCEGADSAQVRLDIVRAVMAYTGLGSDRISVIKMKTT